jgi:hypothetical protein
MASSTPGRGALPIELVCRGTYGCGGCSTVWEMWVMDRGSSSRGRLPARNRPGGRGQRGLANDVWQLGMPLTQGSSHVMESCTRVAPNLCVL